MNLSDYRRVAKEIELECLDRRTAFDKYVNLLIVYAQDGALAGEKYYGTKMVEKGKVLRDLHKYFVHFELKEPRRTSPDSPSSA